MQHRPLGAVNACPGGKRCERRVSELTNGIAHGKTASILQSVFCGHERTRFGISAAGRRLSMRAKQHVDDRPAWLPDPPLRSGIAANASTNTGITPTGR